MVYLHESMCLLQGKRKIIISDTDILAYCKQTYLLIITVLNASRYVEIYGGQLYVSKSALVIFEEFHWNYVKDQNTFFLFFFFQSSDFIHTGNKKEQIQGKGDIEDLHLRIKFQYKIWGIKNDLQNMKD